MRNFRIVLTGGPCAGKTTVYEKLSEYISNTRLCNLFTLGETATEIKKEGIIFKDFENPYDFQNIILNRQTEKESNNKYAIDNRFNNTLDNILLCDRGILDNKAYLSSQEEFDTLLDKYKLKEIDILDSYDLVINLINTANSDCATYETESNDTRIEDESTAQVLDNKTLNAWVAHRNLHIVKCTPKIEDKIKKVFNIVDNLLDENEKKEIEKREIDINNFDLSMYNDENSKKIYIEKTCLDIDTNSKYKYYIIKRTYKDKSSYLLSLESDDNDIIKTKYNRQISEEVANNILNKEKIKSKEDYMEISFIYDFKKFEIDIYSDYAILKYEKDKDINLPNNIKFIEKDENIKIKSLTNK